LRQAASTTPVYRVVWTTPVCCIVCNLLPFWPRTGNRHRLSGTRQSPLVYVTRRPAPLSRLVSEQGPHQHERV